MMQRFDLIWWKKHFEKAFTTIFGCGTGTHVLGTNQRCETETFCLMVKHLEKHIRNDIRKRHGSWGIIKMRNFDVIRRWYRAACSASESWCCLIHYVTTKWWSIMKMIISFFNKSSIVKSERGGARCPYFSASCSGGFGGTTYLLKGDFIDSVMGDRITISTCSQFGATWSGTKCICRASNYVWQPGIRCFYFIFGTLQNFSVRRRCQKKSKKSGPKAR